MAIKKICPRCQKIIDARLKYCEPCQAKVTTYNNKQYDKDRRNRKAADFYHSREWLSIREVILDKSKGLDLYAYVVHKRLTKATTIHHIEELAEAWDKRLSISNLIAVSDQSHAEIHRQYNKGQKEKTKLIALLNRIVNSEYYNI